MGLLSTIGAASGRAFGFTRSAIAAATDAFFNRVTLLLPGNGTNGAQNNTFLDSSTNNFTITRNGNTTQGTFSPFSQTGWSNNFNGSSDSIEFASANTANAMGTGDWTVEAWVYITKTDNQYFFDTLGSGAGATNAIRLRINTSNQLDYSEYSTSVLSGGTVSLHTWTHVAASRSGTTLRLFVNGSQVASATNSSNLVCGTSRPIVGREGYTSGQYIQGYISNLRSVKGQALYTSSFTPSTTPLTTTSQGATASNVSLLTCQSNRFVDNSNGAFVPTISGNTSVQAFSPFAPTAAYSASTVGGSGYFDGSGDYLSVADNAAFDLSSSDFLIEAWAYSTNSTNFKMVIGHWNSGGQGAYTLRQNAGKWAFTYTTNGTTEVALNGTSTQQLNAWAHLAVIRTGTTLSLFVNGTREATASVSGVTIFNSNGNFSVGGNGNGNDLWVGNVGPCRVIKTTLPSGYDATQTTLTVPTAPFTSTASTSILCNFTNAGITDATAKNVLETVGNAQISTTQSKFGGSSMYFDGTGDSCYIPDTPNLKFGTGDLTIECWVYPTATPGGQGAQIIGRHEYGSNAEWIFQITSTSKLNIFLGAGNVATSTGSISNNQWTHIACTRSGSSVRLFINGTIDGTGTYSGSAENGMSGAYTIGSDQGGDEAMYTGYIDDLRITKGYARYTANFTPTTTTFPLQ